MEITFKNIAFELQYNSAMIDAVYAALGFLNMEREGRVAAQELLVSGPELPQKLTKWLEEHQYDTIVFEPHSIPITNQYFGDWDQLVDT